MSVNHEPIVTRSVPAWVEALARGMDGATDPRLGALGRIGSAERRRAAESIELWNVVSLSRVLQPAASLRNDGRLGFNLETFTSTHGRVVLADDHLELDCHGLELTHLDGLNHFGVDGTWHGHVPVDAANQPSIVDWADHGLVTRAVFLDIPAVRSTAWVDPDEPVTGADLEAAMELSGTRVAAGEAVLVYMGRDQYEAAGHRLAALTHSSAIRPGIGGDGAQWLARQQAGAVAWDFLDAHHPDEAAHSVHFLIWSLGLALIDNCDLSSARAALVAKQQKVGMLVVSPLKIPGGTGCAVNPLLFV